MRSNHTLCIGISFVLACFEIGNARAADCLVAVPDDISQAFARGELDAEAVTERDLSGEFVGPQLRDAVQSEAGAPGFVGPMPSPEQQAWGRNLLEEAAEGKFTGQPGVTEYKVGDETYQKIPFSLLNREAVIRIPFEGSQQITFVPVPSAVHMGGGVPAKGPPYLNRFFARGGHGPGYSGGERIRQASGPDRTHVAASAPTRGELEEIAALRRGGGRFRIGSHPGQGDTDTTEDIKARASGYDPGERPTYTVVIKARPAC